MRPVTYSDVSFAARALWAVSVPLRQDLCAQMFYEAEIADRFTRRLGKAHPRWGRGTLAETALWRCLALDPGSDDPDYCTCVTQVLEQFAARSRGTHV